LDPRSGKSSTFTVGVTGHRDLRPADVPMLEAAVRAVFDDLRHHRPATRIVLLSALAEGADQLAARVALACGVPLIAVLPMPKRFYRSTLDGPSREPFDELAAQASEVIELPLGSVTLGELAASGAARAERYDALAVYLVKHSQALIALWDGVASEKKGGTAQVVAGMREDGRGSVHHILTRRLGKQSRTLRHAG
jgi:hypothetical protein